MSDDSTSPARPKSAFDPLPDELDFPSMERRMLDLWDAEDTFERLRQKNADGPRWSFFDGPITANNPMGVHHAWGRTYKDVYQRYRAMRGYHQRYQNGFDCQGLWLEVEVEKDLGFNSKRDIEEFGLEAFADACRERVEKFSGVQTSQSVRLGQWMDWDDSYFTHSDNNIEHIWHFLRRCNERGWIAAAQRAMPWCARCGTALSQHELIDTYEEVEHDAVYVRMPIHGRPDTWLLIWTTTPWTLAANVAAAVHPDLTYVEVAADDGRYLLAEAAMSAVFGEGAEVVARHQGSDLLDLTYDGPFDDLPAVRGVTHRVIPWTDVGADEGTGVVHIAPGAGEEDFLLGQELSLEVLVPIDENGAYTAGYDWLTGRDAREVADDVVADLRQRGLLYRHHTYTHRYPHCWRCHEELVFRVDDEWFIRADEVRQPMLDAAATVNWTPEYAGARMADWLRNMGDWNISRRRYWGLPLPFYPCKSCGHLTVIGSRAHLEERAIEGMDQLRELHRPWIDRVTIRCESCEAPTSRIDAVGDAWLDAGIVPFSTLGYLHNSEEFENWYPADFITEMREQIRLWFYSMLFMSVTIQNQSPYQSVFVYEKLNDETGRAMHKSWGNAIDFGEAAERMGADVMRWLYAGHNPLYNINFGYGPATEVKRRMLTLWNVYSFFVTYARLDGFDPTAPRIPVAERPDLDRWALSRLQGLIDTMTASLDDYLVHRGVQAAQEFVEELSNWYVRRGRRRYWKSDSDDDKQAAYQTLYELLTSLVRLLAPVMPFWTDDIYQNLVRRADPDAPSSVHLTDWPKADYSILGKELVIDFDEVLDLIRPKPSSIREDLEWNMDVVRTIVTAGRQARSEFNLPIRQPLERVIVCGVPNWQCKRIRQRLEEHILEELNVESVEYQPSAILGDFFEVTAKIDFKSVGPRLRNLTKAVATELEERAEHHGDYLERFTTEEGYAIRLHVEGKQVELGSKDVVFQRIPKEGLAVAKQDGVIVALTTTINDRLRRGRLSRELVHAIQGLRRDAGLEVSDRIHLWLDGPAALHETLAAHETEIAAEVLALAVNEGTPPESAAEAAPTLNGVPVKVRLTQS